MLRISALAGAVSFAVSASCTCQFSHPTLMFSTQLTQHVERPVCGIPYERLAARSLGNDKGRMVALRLSDTIPTWRNQRESCPNTCSSDPSTFNLYLLNKDKVPSINLKIASDLNTTDDKYTFDSVDVRPGSGYIFSLKDVSSNNILAQSGEFRVVAHGDDTTTSSATPTATSSSSTTTASSSSSGTASSTDTATGAAARTDGLPVAGGAMGIVGVMCALWGDI